LIFRKNTTEIKCSCSIIQETDIVNFYHLIKIVLARFLQLRSLFTIFIQYFLESSHFQWSWVVINLHLLLVRVRILTEISVKNSFFSYTYIYMLYFELSFNKLFILLVSVIKPWQLGAFLGWFICFLYILPSFLQ
jgi:hypothetical protein